MKRAFAFSTLTLCAAFSSAGIVYGPGAGEAYGTGTQSGHGGAVSPYIFNSNISTGLSGSETVTQIDAITITGLQTSNAQGLNFFFGNGNEFAVLSNGISSEANLNGDFTFVDDESLPTLAEFLEGKGTNETVNGGTFNMSGGFLIFGDVGSGEDMNHFVGTPVDGYTLTLTNSSLVNTGVFTGWTIEVTSAPVPEPGTLAVLGLGGLALLRGRRRS